MNNTIQNNQFKSYGEIELRSTLYENDGILDLQIKQCPTDKTCGPVLPIQIKKLCRYLMSKSLFGNRFGNQFTPQIRCPIKQGHYLFNMSVNLRPVTKFLSVKIRTWVRLTTLEVLPNNRQRTVYCIEAMFSSK